MAEGSGAAALGGKIDVLVIGAGPAGLAASEAASANGARVLLADAMPSVGRKFLMAGKSGLNLTKMDGKADYEAAFAGGFGSRLTSAGPEDIRNWAEGLGQTVFTGSTGRLFPTAMKASPLLRAWIARLATGGVEIRTRWRWTGWRGEATIFETPEGETRLTPGATVLALGGASWRRLGSDGAWTAILGPDGVEIAPFAPANVGFAVDWSDHMTALFGQPVKGTRLVAGLLESRGEWILSARGIEGGGVYAVSRAVRDGAPLCVDLLPDLGADEVARRLARRGKASLGNHLRKALGLDPVRRALLMEWGRPLPEGGALSLLLKRLPVPHRGPRPMDEAISVAGGVAEPAVTASLMLRARPGVFVAGEMLDWEAPTGGYLISGCLATGWAAGRAAAGWTS